MPHYRKYGKQWEPITPEQFLEKMGSYQFPKSKRGPIQQAFITLLYYTGARLQEALNLSPISITVKGDMMFVELGKRLKGGLKTQPLPIPTDKPYVYTIVALKKKRRNLERLFPFSHKTGYNIVSRVLDTYPHHLRLSRITNMLNEGYTIIQVKNWTGHAGLTSLDAYVGIVDIQQMGKSLR